MEDNRIDKDHKASTTIRPSKGLSRRGFLKTMGIATLGLLTARCKPEKMVEIVESPTVPPTEIPAPTPKPTAAPVIPTPTLEPTLAATPSTSLAQVTIGQATSYDGPLLHKVIGDMLDQIGGLADVVSPGDKVAIKVNLTSGKYFESAAGAPAVESYVTHPEVVRVLGEYLRDAGAGKLYIVEAVYDGESYPSWGYVDVAKALDATLIDLNIPDPYSEFATTPVGEGWYIYKDFFFNPILEEVDAFVSVSKMKCHYSVGVTHTMKNLVGLVPVSHYRASPDHWWRSALHGEDYGPKRLPRVIIDLNRARPIHLGLVDGIKTGEGGEVPRGSFALVEPGVLVAGKNPVATDAVATAVMGFDPTINYPSAPFLNGENYLNLANDLGLGTNRLEEIEVVGASIDDVRYDFAPSTRQSNLGEKADRVM